LQSRMMNGLSRGGTNIGLNMGFASGL
jgi:hypothetical protein